MCFFHLALRRILFRCVFAPSSCVCSNEPRLRDDPVFEKYFRMLARGVPKDAVRHQMIRDNVDPRVIDCDPDKPLPDELSPFTKGPPLRLDPVYGKYFKVSGLRVGRKTRGHGRPRVCGCCLAGFVGLCLRVGVCIVVRWLAALAATAGVEFIS